MLGREGTRSTITRTQLEECGLNWELCKLAKFIMVPTGRDDVSLYRVEQWVHTGLVVTPILSLVPPKEEEQNEDLS